MKNMRDVARKSGLEGSEIRIKELAKSLGMPSRPISLKELSNRPAVIVYNTGVIKASAATGSFQVAILSDGGWSFRGSLSSDAFLVGDVFTMEMTLNYVDSMGIQKQFIKTSELGSKMLGPSKSMVWQENGRDQFIEDNWNRIRASGYSGKLTVSDTPGHIFGLVTTGGVVVAGAGALVALVAAGGKVEEFTGGEWRNDENGDPVFWRPPEL